MSMFEYNGERQQNSWKESGRRRRRAETMMIDEIILPIFTEQLEVELFIIIFVTREWIAICSVVQC